MSFVELWFNHYPRCGMEIQPFDTLHIWLYSSMSFTLRWRIRMFTTLRVKKCWQDGKSVTPKYWDSESKGICTLRDSQYFYSLCSAEYSIFKKNCMKHAKLWKQTNKSKNDTVLCCNSLNITHELICIFTSLHKFHFIAQLIQFLFE